MDVFLDMTGTITDMESENRAFLEMCRIIGKRFKINMSAEDIMKKIINFRKPYMDKRHEHYYPIRNLIVMAVEKIEGVKLRGGRCILDNGYICKLSCQIRKISSWSFRSFE